MLLHRELLNKNCKPNTIKSLRTNQHFKILKLLQTLIKQSAHCFVYNLSDLTHNEIQLRFKLFALVKNHDIIINGYSSCPASLQFDSLIIGKDSAILPDGSAAKQT